MKNSDKKVKTLRKEMARLSSEVSIINRIFKNRKIILQSFNGDKDDKDDK